MARSVSAHHADETDVSPHPRLETPTRNEFRVLKGSTKCVCVCKLRSRSRKHNPTWSFEQLGRAKRLPMPKDSGRQNLKSIFH